MDGWMDGWMDSALGRSRRVEGETHNSCVSCMVGWSCSYLTCPHAQLLGELDEKQKLECTFKPQTNEQSNKVRPIMTTHEDNHGHIRTPATNLQSHHDHHTHTALLCRSSCRSSCAGVTGLCCGRTEVSLIGREHHNAVCSWSQTPHARCLSSENIVIQKFRAQSIGWLN